MQIDRSPSRGPYVAALVCLLTLCLTIPVYWQSGAERARDRELGDQNGIDFDGLSRAAVQNLVRTHGYGPFAASNLPSHGPANALDQLLADLSYQPGHISSPESDVFLDLLATPVTQHGDAMEFSQGVVWQYLTELFHRAGRELARLSPGEELGSFVSRLAGRQDPRPQRSDSLPTYSLMLRSPNDRIAALPKYEQREHTANVDAFPTPWCVPATLIERLEVLAEHSYSAAWAQQTIDEVRALTESERPSTVAVAAQLDRLHTLAKQALALANETGDDRLRAELLRAHWGLARRLECWSLMRDIVVASVAQNRFAARVPWDASASPLSGQGSEPADLHSLSGDLEAFEQTRSPRLARAIIQRQHLLAQSEDARQRELGQQIEQNYRNANVRLALSAEMLQRFLPNQHAEMSPVRDRIAGTPVRGRSVTSSENSVTLHPDAQRWSMELESDGTVDSNTVADAGQVKVRSRGTTAFSAQKSIVVEHDGVRLGPSTADAHTCSRLVGVYSSFDWIPVVNEMVRSRAADEFRKKQPYAQAEVEYKVARRVEQQLDDRAGAAVDKMENQVRDRVSGPLESAGVELTPIELSTTDERVVARLRVAGGEQLAGHTPRPRAPADSLASVQLHESALTNAAMSLQLDGKRLTAIELQELMRKKFSRPNQPTATVIEEDTVFEFASQDAVKFRVADERLELILSMREVNHEGNPVRNFRVHAFFVPVIDGLEADFVRDGALGIEGRIRTGERARMHGVFNKVFSEDRHLPIVQLDDPNDARLAGLMITQMVLEDGWIGLAIGPEYANRSAERSRMLR